MLRVKRLHPDAILPTVANVGEDHGYDLYALEDVVIHPGQSVTVKTGIAIEFEPKAGARIADRSSMGKKRIFKLGGEIDSGYRGEVAVMLYNASQPLFYHMTMIMGEGIKLEPDYSKPHPHTLFISKGDKIAQLVREDAVIDDGVVEGELSPSSRGANGFGSSGR